MSFSFIMNELFILLIGMSIGVGLNMMMLSQTKHARKWIALIDERIRELLRKLALQIREEENVSIDINETRNLIQNASKRLHEYQNNQLRSDLAYFIQYTSMRISQLNVLEGINDVAQQISAAPQQANTIADFLEEIADSYHEQNQVITLFIRHDEILKRYQASELPVSRKEFEERARLFQILTMVRQFLLLKREFVKNMTSLQRDTYWYKEEIE